VSVVVVEMLEKPGVGGGVNVGGGVAVSQTRSLCQETVVRWFANYTVTASHSALLAMKSRYLTISSLLFAYSAMTHTCLTALFPGLPG